jgi:hypothetical protein
MDYKDSVRFPNAYGMPGMQRVYLTHLLVRNSPTAPLLPANTAAEDLPECPCSICLEEIPEEAGIFLLPCHHHLFCQECMWNWLDNGRSTCPLCRTFITAVMTRQHGLVLLEYVNDAGEEIDPQPEVEENQDESVGDNEDQQAWATVPIVSAVLPRSENAQSGRPPSRPPRLVDGTLLSPPGRGLVAPNPTPEDTPNHSPSSRPAPASISEDSHETENPTTNVWSRVDATAEANRSQTPTQPPRRQTLSIGRSPPRLAFGTNPFPVDSVFELRRRGYFPQYDAEEHDQESTDQDAEDTEDIAAVSAPEERLGHEPETLGEAVPATRMGDDTSHPDTSSTTGDLGHDWLTMEVRFIPYDHLVGYDEVLSFDPINLDVD